MILESIKEQCDNGGLHGRIFATNVDHVLTIEDLTGNTLLRIAYRTDCGWNMLEVWNNNTDSQYSRYDLANEQRFAAFEELLDRTIAYYGNSRLNFK